MQLKWQWLAAFCLAMLILAPSPLANASSDPQLNVLSFDFTPKIIDTGLSSQTITFTAHLTAQFGIKDTGPGVPTQVQFLSPSGNQGATVLFQTPINLQPGGTAQDGIFVNTMQLPQGSEPGTWVLYVFTLADQANPQNKKYLYQSDISALGFSTTFQVKNTRVIFLPLILRSGH